MIGLLIRRAPIACASCNVDVGLEGNLFEYSVAGGLREG